MASYKHILIPIHGIYRYYYMNKIKKKRFSDVKDTDTWRLSLISEWILSVTTYILGRGRQSSIWYQEGRRQWEHRSMEQSDVFSIREGRTLPYNLRGNHGPADALILTCETYLGFLASRIVRISACFLSQSCMAICWSFQETDNNKRVICEEPRWRRNRTGRPLSLLQIH